MSGQARAVLAATKAKMAKQRIKDIWVACLSVEYKEAKKTSPAEVVAVLNGLNWEGKYTILGKNKHVYPKICLKNFFGVIFGKTSFQTLL